MKKYRGQVLPRIAIYLSGLLVMSLGIVLLIKGSLGATPWDVLHVGLYYQLGLTIGSWSIIAGFVILGISAIMLREIPQIGAFANMVLVGVFIDMYLWMSFVDTPESLAGKILMFCIGMILQGYGMGMYISARFGAGPRDSLMMAIVARTSWKVGNVRSLIEVIVMAAGWQLGGPVYWGTIIFSLGIGQVTGLALPQCERAADTFLARLQARKKGKRKNKEETNRSATL